MLLFRLPLLQFIIMLPSQPLYKSQIEKLYLNIDLLSLLPL